VRHYVFLVAFFFFEVVEKSESLDVALVAIAAIFKRIRVSGCAAGGRQSTVQLER
jgi:hypothetical protein